ncbi:hypothetical protein GGI21_005334 [Coemansia aciculifera]|nr:hypothetical protein GGI21_005334 [Coemansia aciculifera]
MDLDKQAGDPALEASVARILQAAPPTTAQLVSPAVCKRLVQFGSTAKTLDQFEGACRMFGRFDRDALESVYSAIQSHRRHAPASAVPTSSVFGSAHTTTIGGTNSATEEPAESSGGGGLIYVPKSKRSEAPASAESESKGRQSVLGLDARAAKLRAEAVASMNRKRAVMSFDEEEAEKKKPEPVTFKHAHVPTNLRHRRADTPSDPGGVSATAQQRLKDHRRRLHGLEDN